MRALFVTLVLAATAAPVAQDQQSAPNPVSADGTAHRTVVKECDCGTAYRTALARDWNLHRPSTPKERAETSRLNREYLEASRMAARVSALPPAPDAAQLAYQQQMKNYRALTDSYERRMRDYNRLHAQAEVAERNWQDAARLAPYRGYNSGPGNGY